MLAAGVWVRLKAFMLDYIGIVLYLLMVAVLTVFIAPEIQNLFQSSLGIAQLTGFLLVTLPISLYFAVFDARHFSGTFGKKKMKLQVVGLEGKGIGIVRSFIRVAFKFLPWELSHFLVYRLVQAEEESIPLSLSITGGSIYGLMILYIATAFFSKQKRTFYDFLSGTKVIKKV
nr:RDD family protein [Planococcus sp. CP5-4_YE]